MRKPARHFQRKTIVGAGEFDLWNGGRFFGHGLCLR
jgi:hypothetical protein